MSEYCFHCFNKINEEKESEKRYVMSRELDLCEGCGQYKRVVVKERLWSRMQKALAETRKNRK